MRMENRAVVNAVCWNTGNSVQGGTAEMSCTQRQQQNTESQNSDTESGTTLYQDIERWKNLH